MHLIAWATLAVNISRMSEDGSANGGGRRGVPARSVVATDWEELAKQVLKAELARQGVTYKALVKRLDAIGVKDDEKAIANRISRGRFQFIFFVQCMRALGVTDVDLRDRRRG
jgi:hypothetical protein